MFTLPESGPFVLIHLTITLTPSGTQLKFRTKGVGGRALSPKFIISEFFVIYFPRTDIYEAYHRSKLRPAQEWFEGKWSPKKLRPATSGVASIASSPWDLQTNAQYERQFEQEVKKHCERH